MGVFEDVIKFLEDRLEEFLRDRPDLEWQALEEQLKEQEDDTLRLIVQLQKQEQRKQDEILATAQDIQTWHARIGKAQAAGRQDLAQAAQEREAALLRQGNLLWGQLQGIKERIEKAKEIYYKIQQRRQEVKAKATEAAAARARVQAQQQATRSTQEFVGWNQPADAWNIPKGADPLEDAFQALETNEELERMKRNMR